MYIVSSERLRIRHGTGSLGHHYDPVPCLLRISRRTDARIHVGTRCNVSFSCFYHLKWVYLANRWPWSDAVRSTVQCTTSTRLSAAVHYSLHSAFEIFFEYTLYKFTFYLLTYLQTYLPYLAMVKNPKIRSCDLDVWSMTLKFNRVLEILEIHVGAKFHRAKCSGSWVIVVTEKKNSAENNTVRR